MIPKIFTATAIWTLCVCVPLSAQESPWPGRVLVSVDVPFQALENDATEALTFADSIRRTENVDFRMQYPSTRAAAIDVGAAVRIAGNLGAGVVTSWTERSHGGSFGLKVPNPLIANSPLELEGTIGDLNRRELAVHLQAAYACALGRTVRLMLLAGPSIFRVEQDLVRNVEIDILPGFRALQLDQASITRETQNKVGFNAGADLTWSFASHFGVGTVIRYSRASLTWKPTSTSGVSRNIETHAGGLHIGGGIRMFF